MTVLGLAWLVGCGGGPTTVLLHVEAPLGVSVQALYGQVSMASQPAGVEQQLSGPVQLPGTLTVWLPDTTDRATIALRALTTDGGTLRATVEINPIPHGQVEQFVMLGVGNTGAAGAGADAGAPPDLATASPDLTTPITQPDMSHPPDLSPVVLAQDNFHRAANQLYWGTASDGHVWGADANTSTAFSIVNNTGQVTDSVSENLSAVLGPTVADSEVLVNGSITTFGTSTSNNEIAPMLRWVDNNLFYKAGINGTILRLYIRTSANTATTLASTPFAASPNVPYLIRFRAVGTSLMAKAWQAGTTEPAGWMVTATDAQIATGMDGIRLVFNQTATVTFTSFVATPP
jgi:hypothetical protein